MAYVVAAPELMTAKASDLAALGSNVSAAHMVAAARTTSVIPAAADEVSVGIAGLFSQHAQGYQAVAGHAAAFNEQFVQNLKTSAASYTSIEALITSFLNDLVASYDTLAASLPMPLVSLLDVLLVVAGFMAIALVVGFLEVSILLSLVVETLGGFLGQFGL